MAAMSQPLVLHPDRLLPPEPGVRALARSLYGHVRDLPIISPHGHTDPGWFAYNEPFGDAVDLLLAPDHYLYRMLYSQGVSLDQLGVRSRQGTPAFEPRAAWRQFASHYKLFRGTPSALWLDQVFAEVFGLTVPQRRIFISMPLGPRSGLPRSGHARCSRDSTSKSWRRRRARRIRSRLTRKFGVAAGRGG
jgi:hypothetical protein